MVKVWETHFEKEWIVIALKTLHAKLFEDLAVVTVKFMRYQLRRQFIVIVSHGVKFTLPNIFVPLSLFLG